MGQKQEEMIELSAKFNEDLTYENLYTSVTSILVSNFGNSTPIFINFLFSDQVTSTDHKYLPDYQNICSECCKNLTIGYRIKTQCMSNNNELQKIKNRRLLSFMNIERDPLDIVIPLVKTEVESPGRVEKQQPEEFHYDSDSTVSFHADIKQEVRTDVVMADPSGSNVSPDLANEQEAAESNGESGKKKKKVPKKTSLGRPSSQLGSYICEFCNSKLTAMSSLERHLKKIHKMKRSVECKTCHRLFFTKALRDRHSTKFHSDTKKLLV